MDALNQPEGTAPQDGAATPGAGGAENQPAPALNVPVVLGSPAQLSEEERTWAMLAHLSMLLNLVTGLLGPIFALVIYFAYREKYRYVGFQAMQSFLFQLVMWIGAGAVIAMFWIITAALSIVLVGLCLIPIGIVISCVPLAAVVYSVIGGLQCNQGQDFRYWLIADLAQSFLPAQ